MTILVTGAAGQDGILLSQLLTSYGLPVIALCRPSQSTFVQEMVPGLSTIPVDLQDFKRVSEILEETRPTKIFNLAGFSSVRDSWHHPELTFQINTELPKLMINWVKHASPETVFIQATSSEIFAASTDSPQSEKSKIAPTSPYGESKAQAHSFLTQMRDSENLKLMSVVLYNHESPLRSPAFVTRHISRGIAKIVLGLTDTLPIGNVNSQRDWGWAPDYVRALWEISELDKPENYVLSTGLLHTVSDLISFGFESVEISNYEKFLVTDFERARKVDPQSLVGDSSYVKEKIGWEPTLTIKQVLAKMVLHDIRILEHASGVKPFDWLD